MRVENYHSTTPPDKPVLKCWLFGFGSLILCPLVSGWGILLSSFAPGSRSSNLKSLCSLGVLPDPIDPPGVSLGLKPTLGPAPFQPHTLVSAVKCVYARQALLGRP